MKQNSKLNKEIIDKLDHLWSLKVKERDNFKCQLCGSSYNISSHHIIKRGHFITRWDILNGITLCVNCHLDVHSLNHKLSLETQDKILNWFVQQFDDLRTGGNIWDELMSKKHVIKKHTSVELEELYKELRD